MKLEDLRKDMVAAMKAKDKDRKEAISSLVSAAKKAAIDEGCRDAVPEELVDRVILKELKSVKEQIDSCPADRTELLEEYQKRYQVIQEYAPKQYVRGRSTGVYYRKVCRCGGHKEQRTDHESGHGGSEGESRRQSHQSGGGPAVPVR